MHTFFESGDTPQTMRDLNEEILLCIQIESRKAIENLDDILSVPGVDVAYIGPADLSQSLGDPGNTENPDHVQACHPGNSYRVFEECSPVDGRRYATGRDRHGYQVHFGDFDSICPTVEGGI
jgi:hypothetical protein